MIIKKLFKFIKNLSPIIIQTPTTESVGNMSQHIYHGLITARKLNKKVLFLFPYDLFKPFYFSKFKLGVNSELKKIESEYLFLSQKNIFVIFLNILLTTTYIFIISIRVILEKLFVIKLPRFFRRPTIGYKRLWINPKNTEYINNLSIRLSDKTMKIGETKIREMGIPKGAWYVCVYARDGGFYSSKNYKEGTNKKIRNSNIKNYIKAIKLITDRGGWVIRMGDRNMQPLSKIKNVIDYPFSEFKSDLMDLYLIKNCSFFIGNHSGITGAAIMFEKPCLFPNCPLVFSIKRPLHYGSLFIPKHIFCRKMNRNLTISEALEKLECGIDFSKDDNYLYVENSEDEIFDLVKEFLERKSNTNEYTKAQMEWNKKIDESIKIFMDRDFNKNSPRKIREEMYEAFHQKGTIGNAFLSKYY